MLALLPPAIEQAVMKIPNVLDSEPTILEITSIFHELHTR